MSTPLRTATPERSYDHDVVVIGSGFGGAVTALRAAEKGYDVLVYEAGRRFEDEDFAKTSWNLPRYLWAPKLKCFGVQRLHRLPDAMILAGAGVGGGSLNYANTLYKPPSPFFQDPQWGRITDWESELTPHYDTAKRMLGVVEENPCFGPIEQLMKDTADELGVGETFRKTPVGVYFGEAGTKVDDPFFGGEGPARTGCTECGNCMVGCRVGAKNTLMKNYLALAERKGVEIRARRTVVSVEPLGDKGFRVVTEETGAWVAKRQEVVTAEQVVFAAGTWGTQTLLHKLRDEGVLPDVSDRLGVLTRTNSEAIEGAAAVTVPEHMEVDKGIAITTSFHVDETTHIENVRYGKGSNAMGLLQTLLVNGDEPPVKRAVGFGKELIGNFVPNMRALLAPHWSERTVIALVMQTLDNSITVSSKKRFGRRVLTSKQGHGVPSPTYIPAGQKAVRALAKKFGERANTSVIAGGNWAEAFGVPMTAHFLGGAVISESPASGVVDPYQRIWGYPGLHVVDGTAVSANLGVNPSLTITAQAERALSLWPAKGETDQRPAQGEPYRRLPSEPARLPGVDLGLPAVRPAS